MTNEAVHMIARSGSGQRLGRVILYGYPDLARTEDVPKILPDLRCHIYGSNDLDTLSLEAMRCRYPWRQVPTIPP